MGKNKKPVVPRAKDMDDETFLLHFNKRHMDSLPGLTGQFRYSPLAEYGYLRAYHKHIHQPDVTVDVGNGEFEPVIDHEHRRVK